MCVVLSAAHRDSLADGVRWDIFITIAGWLQVTAVPFYVFPYSGPGSISSSCHFSGFVSIQCGVKLQRAPT